MPARRSPADGSREVPFLAALQSVFGVSWIPPRSLNKEHSKYVFAVLRRSRRVQTSRRARSPHAASTSPSPSSASSSRTSSTAATSSSSRRPGRARRSPSASRWSIGSSPATPAAGGARPRPDPRARRRRSSTSSRRSPQARGLCDRRRLRRRRLRPADQARPRAPTSSSPRPGRLEDLIERGVVNLDARPDARPRRGRPDARHGLQARRRPDRRPDPGRSPDPVLLGNAGGGGRQGRPRPTPTTPRRHVHAPKAEKRVDDRAPLRPRRLARRQAPALVGELRDSERGRTLVFVRTKRGADRLVKRLGQKERQRGRDARQQVAVASARRRSPASSAATSTRSSPPTSPPAASTSPTITHVINFDAPEDRDVYMHRIGRTGRAGATGAGISFVLPDQAREMRRIAKQPRARARVRPQPLGLTGPVPWYRSDLARWPPSSRE